MAGAGVPVVVTVKVPAAPWVKVVVAAEVMAGAVSTVSEKDVVWVVPVPVPVTVMGYVPAGVVDEAVRVMTELAPEVTVDGEKPTVVPVGRPVAVNPTVWGLPDVVVVLMVLVAGVPTTAEPEAGDAAMEKSPGGGGGVPALNRANPSAQYMVDPKDPAKLWAAVEVRTW
jgi:hypothetical protein